MADIKSIQVDGIDYAIKDETARNSIGNLEATVTELSAKTDPIQRVESLDESNLKNLRDLETGSYVLYGYFRPYAGASNYLPFDNLLVNVYHVDEGSHLFEFSTANSEVNFIEILVDSTADSGFTYSRTAISMLELNGLIGKMGNLNELATTEKGSVVAAINEVAASGGSGSSVQADLSQNDSTQPDYVKNRTHWVEGSGATIEWDGNTEGRDSFIFNGLTFYKVSDEVSTFDELIGARVGYLSGSVEESSVLNEDAIMEGDNCLIEGDSGRFIIAQQTECYIMDFAFSAPSVGTYFSSNSGDYTTKLSYGHYTYHPMYEEFIPETIARKSDVPTIRVESPGYSLLRTISVNCENLSEMRILKLSDPSDLFECMGDNYYKKYDVIVNTGMDRGVYYLHNFSNSGWALFLKFIHTINTEGNVETTAILECFVVNEAVAEMVVSQYQVTTE